MSNATQASDQMHRFRCLDSGHELVQPRSDRTPLVTRQSTWCTEHDAPAVLIDGERSRAEQA